MRVSKNLCGSFKMNNTIAYIIFGVVMLHLVLGFAWVIYKFSKKSDKKNENDV